MTFMSNINIIILGNYHFHISLAAFKNCRKTRESSNADGLSSSFILVIAK